MGIFEALDAKLDQVLAQQAKILEYMERSPALASTTTEVDELLDYAGVCELIGKGRSTVAGYVSAGTIPHMKQGNSVRFSKRIIFEWMAQQAGTNAADITSKAKAYRKAG